VKSDSLSLGEWRVSLEQDHVHIEVSSVMKESIDNNRSSQSVRSVLLNSIYFSAVVHAIQRLKDDSDLQEFKWGKIMERQIHNQHIELATTDAYVIAQKLMKHPLAILNNYILKADYA